MLDYDPVKNLQHYPQSMARFGVNPYNENLYRLVHGGSRRYLVSGEWPDGSVGARWVLRYKQYKTVWIIEKWLSAEEICPEGKEWWARECAVPFPDRGDYELAHAFETASPDQCDLDKLIAWIGAGKRYSLDEKIVYAREQAAQEKKATASLVQDISRNRLPAFGCRPFFSRRVSRGSEKIGGTVVRTAEELGLPTKNGATRTHKNPNRVAPGLAPDLGHLPAAPAF
jgi:hypothetical protein